MDSAALLKELVAIGIAIAGEPHLRRLLDLTLSGALRLTRAEAGAIYLLKPEGLEFALVKNPVLTRRYGEAEVNGRFEGQRLPLDGSSLAGYVASTGQALNVPDAYRIPPTAPYQLQARYDREKHERIPARPAQMEVKRINWKFINAETLMPKHLPKRHRTRKVTQPAIASEAEGRQSPTGEIPDVKREFVLTPSTDDT